MFRTLAEEGINIQMVTTSEIKTSVVIDEKYMELKGMRCTARSNWSRALLPECLPGR